MIYDGSYTHHLCLEIERHFNIFFQQLESDSSSSARIHTENAGRHRRFLTPLRMNLTCLHCCCRCPERHLSCGHAICDICIRIFGGQISDREDRFHIRCIFGDQGNLTVDLKPRTAGLRIMSFDGGGSRGVVPLEYLRLLQDLLPGCPLHEQIDFAAGTSSGTKMSLRLGKNLNRLQVD